MKGQLIYQFQNKDILRRYGKGLVLDLQGKRRVLSTSMLNGGLSDEIKHVFNYNCLADQTDCMLSFDSYEKELAHNASSLLLDPKITTGLSTAAFVELASIVTKEYRDLSVTAIVTGGIDYNAVRVGDPASYYELSNVYEPLPKGTINILLAVNQSMPAGTMVRAGTIITEAKVAAIQELMLGSNYSTGIATGSGTDGFVLISDLEALHIVTDAGGHSKLGELIGLSVKEAVKEALLKQTSASPARQHSILERGKRYGISIGSLWEHYQMNADTFSSYLSAKNGHSFPSLKEFEKVLYSIQKQSNVVIFTSLYLHLIDQYQWGLIEWAEILRESRSLCEWFLSKLQIDTSVISKISYETTDPFTDLLDQLHVTLLYAILNSNYE